MAGNSPSSPLRFADPANAAIRDGEDLRCYFGTGCFWHIQREFVEMERRLLGRSDRQLTSRTGYAGGTEADASGRVCYHNLAGAPDYGRMGHAEVVGLSVPPSRLGDFADAYFALFDPATGDRVDPGDRGPEYRYLLGLPGGDRNPAFDRVAAAARAGGKRLVAGRGGDPDTFRRGIVYYYDSEEFPFHRAEVYHQFHDDFRGPHYGRAYNRLAELEFDAGFIEETGCPDSIGVQKRIRSQIKDFKESS